MKNFIFTISFLFIASLALAAEPTETNDGPDLDVPAANTLLNVQRFTSKKFGTVNVILRTDGEVVAQPYAADIRLNCAKGANRNWKKLRNTWMQTACQLEKENITFEAGNDRLVIRYLDVDAADYNRQSKEPDIKSPVMKCKKKPTILRLSLEELCAKQATYAK